MRLKTTGGRSWWPAAVAGLAAGAAAVAFTELAAGLINGAPSAVVEIGGLVIALQPAGAKQVAVDLFGTADKLALSVAVAAVALLGAAVLGILAARHARLAEIGFVAAGVLALGASLRDPLVDPLLAVLSTAAAVLLAVFVLRRLLRLAGLAAPPPTAEMPDWSRRRFLGTSIATVGAAATAGVVGRLLLDESRVAAPGAALALPATATRIPPLAPEASLPVPGITPLIVSNERFYRIDTSLLVPRLDARTWRLRVSGMVDQPLTLTYAQLLALPMAVQYVTIACVSNEVGGDLVGNALWGGVPLRHVLDMAGVRSGATQIVGRAFDGWTCGFPTAWIMEPRREALIAVSMNGQPLPAEHGFPARLIVPGLYGYVSATKWLTELQLTTLEAFDAYWVPLGWAKEAPILTQSRIDTPRGGASVPRGAVPIAGVAWAPDRGISRVEVQIDDGAWSAAELPVEISSATWVQWVYRWTAAPGSHQLRVRATDGTGALQDARVTRPPPDGARGYHTIQVAVA